MKKLIILIAIFLLTGCSQNSTAVVTENQKGNAPQYINMLEDFINNPSVEKFYSVCEQGKNIPTYITKEILSDDRLSMEYVPISLYEAMSSCYKINDEDFAFVMMASDNNGLLAELKDLDTDEIRTKKLQWNKQWQGNLNDQPMIGYNKISAKDITPFLEATVYETKVKQMYGGYHDFGTTENIYLPVDEARNILSNYRRQQYAD